MIGTTIGKLTDIRQIGEGGMGAVYLAEHRVLKTLHVVKVLLPQWTQNAMIVQRFVNEARAAAAIRHRNIIGVQDCDQLPDGQWYITMEYLDGGTLARYAASQGGPLSQPLILHLVAQIANGLSAAHAREIVHRDLKPENVYLTTKDGNPHHVTILDFGIAKLGEATDGPATRTGQMAGTPAYMAPEQMRDLKSVDPRTDIYALGVITYQLATGGWLPYQEGGTPSTYYELSSAELYHRQLTRPPVDPRQRFAGISESWANTILAALHPDPERRPQAARQLAILLAEATPGDHFWPNGIEIIKNCARELLDIGNMQETVRAPKPATSPSSSASSRYQIGDRLGAGGMAEVFRGTMTGAEGFARDVAIKRVLPGFSTMPQFATMFVEEARIASQLGHPNIVQVLDFDRDPEGRLFLVMEFVEGRDLDALGDTGMLPSSMINFVITEVLRGLGYAHNLPAPKHGMRGVVHRDVSPHNVLLSWEGAVKVSDFGIAKAREASAATASTMIKGKAAYMSPEQANGEELDGRSDLFAVGVILWQLLAGRPLFVGTTQEAIAQVFFRPIPRPSTLRPGVSPDLEAVAMRLLDRDRNARYATAEQAIGDLARCRDAPRDGRGELVRLLAERFASAITERASGRIEGGAQVGKTSSRSKVTAPARPQQSDAPAASWGPPPTTLGYGASQAIALAPQRSRMPYVLAGVAVIAVVGVILALKSSSNSPGSQAASPQVGSSIAPAIDAPSKLEVRIETVPSGAQVQVDGQPRGASPITLSLAPGTRFEVIASRDGFVEASTSGVAERGGQLVSLTLTPTPSAIDAGVQVAKPTGSKRSTGTTSTKTKPSGARSNSGSNARTPGFDPNEVGGD